MSYNRRRLPFVEPNLIAGLVTKWTQESTAGVGLREAINCDAFDEYGALSQIHGSTRRSGLTKDEILNTLSGTISRFDSINYFEGFNLDGQLQRRVLTLASGTGALSSGTLFFVNPDKSLTQLTGTEDYLFSPEPLHGITMLDRHHLTSPKNFPLKVDIEGNVSKWGLDPPGAASTTIHDFDDLARTDVFGGNLFFSRQIPPDENEASGSAAINREPDNDQNIETIVTISGVDYWPENLSELANGHFQTYLFIPDDGLPALHQGPDPAVQVMHDSDTGLRSVFDFQVGELNEGWNILSMNIDSPTSTGIVDPSNIDVLKLRLAYDPINVFGSSTRTGGGGGNGWVGPSIKKSLEFSFGISNKDLRNETYNFLNFSNTFTVAIWMKIITGGVAPLEEFFTLDGQGAPASAEALNIMRAPSNSLAIQLFNPSGITGKDYRYETAQATINNNEWRLIAVTWLGSLTLGDGDLKAYVDGVEVPATTLVQDQPVVYDGSVPFQIRMVKGDSIVAQPTVRVAAAGIWSGPLSGPELSTLWEGGSDLDWRYNQGSYVSKSTLVQYWKPGEYPLGSFGTNLVNGGVNLYEWEEDSGTDAWEESDRKSDFPPPQDS